MTQALKILEKHFVFEGFKADPAAAPRYFKNPDLDPAEGLKDVLWLAESGLLVRLDVTVAREIVAYADGVLEPLVDRNPQLVAMAARALPSSDAEGKIFSGVETRCVIEGQAIRKLAETDPACAITYAHKAAYLSFFEEKNINYDKLEPIDGVRAPWNTLIETLAMLGRSDPAAGLEAARTIWKETLPTDTLTMSNREKEIARDFRAAVLGMIPEALPAPSVAAFATCYKWLYDDILDPRDTVGREKAVASASKALGPLASQDPEYVAAFALCSLQVVWRKRLSASMCAKHPIPLLYSAQDLGPTTADYDTQRALLTAGLEATRLLLSHAKAEEAVRYARAFHQVAPFLDWAHQGANGGSDTCEMEAVQTVALTVGNLVFGHPERGLAVAQELWNEKPRDERLLNGVRTSLIEALPRWMPTRSVESLDHMAPWLMGKIAYHADDPGKAKVAGFLVNSLEGLSEANPSVAAFTALDILRRKERLNPSPNQIALVTDCFTTSLPKIQKLTDVFTLLGSAQSLGLEEQHAVVVADLDRRLRESPTVVLNALATHYTLEPACVVLGDTPEARARKIATLGIKPT